MANDMDPTCTNISIDAPSVVAIGRDDAIVGFWMEDEDGSDEFSVFFRTKGFEKATRLFAMATRIRGVWYGGDELWGIDRFEVHRFSGKSFKRPTSSTTLPITIANAIAGRAPNDLYVVGQGIARFDGASWNELPGTDKREFNCIAIHGGVAYAAGKDGVLVEIAGNEVRALAAPAPSGADFEAIHIDSKGILSVGGNGIALQGPPGALVRLEPPNKVAVIVGIAELHGTLYWSAVGDDDGFGLFAQHGKTFELVNGRIAGGLSTSERFLYLTGDAGAVRFDGNDEWRFFALAFDDDKGRWILEPCDLEGDDSLPLERNPEGVAMEIRGISVGSDDNVFLLVRTDSKTEPFAVYRMHAETSRAEVISRWKEPVVAIWSGSNNAVTGAGCQGEILSMGTTVEILEDGFQCDVWRISGWDDELRFCMGFEGNVHEHRDGKWTKVKSMGKGDINSVARRTKDEFVFCTAGGKLLTYVPGKPATAQKITKGDLNGITFVSPEEGYAVGEKGAVFKFDGKTWTDLPTKKLPNLSDVHAFHGKVFASTGDRIFEIDRTMGTLQQVHDGGGQMFASNDTYCVTAVDDAVSVFDGKSWKTVRPL